jgi:hypothetical protein
VLTARQSLRAKLTGKIENTQVELQTVEVSLDTQAKKLQETIGKHQVLKEKASVKSSGTLKKRHRGRNMAAGLCGQQKDGSQRKVIAAHRDDPP